jgi:hypothetical protein
MATAVICLPMDVGADATGFIDPINVTVHIATFMLAPSTNAMSSRLRHGTVTTAVSRGR